MRKLQAVIGTAVLLAAVGSVNCSKKSNPPTAPGGGSGNHAPTISVNVDKLKLLPTQSAQVTVVASDPNSYQLTFSYTATGGSVTSSGPTATTATFVAGSAWGPATITVTADNGHGGITRATASLYVQNPNVPSASVQTHDSATSDCFWVDVRFGEDLYLDDYQISYPGASSFQDSTHVMNVFVPAGHTVSVPGTPSCWPHIVCPTSRRFIVFHVHRPEPDGRVFPCGGTWFFVGREGC